MVAHGLLVMILVGFDVIRGGEPIYAALRTTRFATNCWGKLIAVVSVADCAAAYEGNLSRSAKCGSQLELVVYSGF